MTSLELRRATDGDAQAVADLINSFDEVFTDDPERISRRDVIEFWQHEGEPWLALDGGELAGFAFIRRRGERWDGDGYVHPRAFGRGIGSALVELVERRAGELGSPEARLAVYRNDERAGCLLRRRGYERIRSFFRMLIDLDEEPSPAVWPDGFTVSTITPAEEHDLYAVLEESFLDHWGHNPRTFEEWMRARRIQHDLCFLVRAAGEIAAGAECKIEDSGIGAVDVLGTRREYRRRGLGEALLHHAFREFYARGARQVALGVDAESLTGATRLYERVGMRVASTADLYAKPL